MAVGRVTDSAQQMQVDRAKEQQVKQNQLEMKKEKDKFDHDYNKLVTKNEQGIKRGQKEYEDKVHFEEMELEKKLNSLRIAHKTRVQDENDRLNKELEDLKKTHGYQVGELKETQANEINNMILSHQESLDVAKQKYEKAMNKYKTS